MHYFYNKEYFITNLKFQYISNVNPPSIEIINKFKDNKFIKLISNYNLDNTESKNLKEELKILAGYLVIMRNKFTEKQYYIVQISLQNYLRKNPNMFNNWLYEKINNNEFLKDWCVEPLIKKPNEKFKLLIDLNNSNFKKKYLKYKIKYLKLKKL
jgi:hypothetical protein